MLSSITRLDCRWSIHSQGSASKTSLGPGIREEKIGKAVYVHGDEAEEHMAQLGAIRHKQESSEVYPVPSLQQTAAPVPLTLCRCCHFCLFRLSFPPHAGQNRVWDMQGQALPLGGSWGEGPTRRCLMLNAGEEKE